MGFRPGRTNLLIRSLDGAKQGPWPSLEWQSCHRQESPTGLRSAFCNAMSARSPGALQCVRETMVSTAPAWSKMSKLAVDFRQLRNQYRHRQAWGTCSPVTVRPWLFASNHTIRLHCLLSIRLSHCWSGSLGIRRLPLIYLCSHSRSCHVRQKMLRFLSARTLSRAAETPFTRDISHSIASCFDLQVLSVVTAKYLVPWKTGPGARLCVSSSAMAQILHSRILSW